jgi:glycosyltransferase involved in cell wall biosynthesis
MIRVGPSYRLQELNLFKILYFNARKCPEVNIVIAGCTSSETRRKFGLFQIPKNLIFVGRISSDNVLKVLYNHASLVVFPIFFRSISNRLIGALYYGKPILTNSFAKLIHNKLDIFITYLYQTIIQNILALLEDCLKMRPYSKSLLQE